MSSTVEIYLADSADPVSVAQRVSVALEVPGYFSSGETFIVNPDAQRWIGAEGYGSLTLDRTEFDADDRDEMAFAPYNYELSLEYKSGPALARDELRERFGRALFDRLITLDRPLAFGDNRDIFADFLPGRGVRDFGSGVSLSASGRDRWYEERLSGDVQTPVEVPDLSAGEATVVETDGLLHFVPRSAGTGRLATPVASLRSSVGPHTLGRGLAEALGCSRSPGEGEPSPRIHSMAGLNADEYAKAAVSIDIKTEGDTVTALPHAGYTGEPVGHVMHGSAIEPLAVRETGPWDDKAMGRLVLRLVTAMRDHAYA